MAKMRLQNEWKMWAAFAVLLLLVVGYLYLASRPPMEDGEYLWRVTRIIDEKDLDLKGSGTVIQLRLIGIRVAPAEEQAAREYLTKNLENQWIRIKILREDPKGVKEGFVFFSKEDVIARMIRQGIAEVDREERAYDIRPYIELEQEAKREHKGMWRQTDSGAK
ncbi:MAG TPA: thermonuclease family protein [Desulfomonilaceae bacterium]|nr:thermonuclease family protein [Desulfomonilaceae bacterium]